MDEKPFSAYDARLQPLRKIQDLNLLLIGGFFMSKSRRIAVDGMLAAIYFALKLLTIPIGNDLEISVATLALVTTAFLLHPADVCAVGFVGELLTQVVRFSFSPISTPIWVAPTVIYALVLGLCTFTANQKRHITEQPALCYAVCIGCGVVLACCNTAALYFDSKIIGYYSYHMVFGVALLRALVAMGAAIVVASVALPLVRTLRKKGLARI